MNLLKCTRWMAIAIGLLSGPALAASVVCTVSPVNSIITEGQALKLQADCDGALDAIDWKMDGTSITGSVPLAGHIANQPLYYTTPVGLGGSNTFAFEVTGAPAAGNTWGSSTTATVVVKPSSAAVALAAGSPTPTAPVDAQCGSADGTTAAVMPSNGAQCVSTKGTPALAISGPTSFTWSCISRNGGNEANCSALRGFTVTATHGANGSVSIFPGNGGVAAGGTATVTASPNSNFSASFGAGTNCPGTASGNQFTAGPITANCTVNATFTNAPQAAACGSAHGVASLAAPSAGLCAAGTLLGGVASGTGQFTWTCNGPNGGANASCTAPMLYTVNAAVSGTGGAINAPSSKTVAHNGTTSFSVTPEGTNIANASGCGASVSGNTVTTGAVTGACTVTVSFGPASQCGALPANTTVYTTTNREPYVSDLDTLFDLATTASSLDSLVAANRTKSYEFSNDKAFKNGSLYNFYSTGPKDMSISACPGDFNVPAECKVMASMGPRVYWSRDGAPYVHPAYSFLTYQTCNIGTGGKFYMNIRSGTTGVSYQIRNEVLNK